MAKMDTVLATSGSFAYELIGLLRDLRIGLRAQLERTFPETPFTPGPGSQWPRVKDKDSFAAGIEEACEAANGIGPAGLKVFELIRRVDVEITRIKTETERVGIVEWRRSGTSWGCDEITVYRREAQYYMQQVFAYAATLHSAVQRTLWNVEFICDCPPHPRDAPSTPPGYPWHARKDDLHTGEFDHGDELKGAIEARAAAERAARDAEAEWKVQSERAAELEVQGRQEKEARWAAERTLRETEARAKQAEQGRSDAERLAEEAEASRQAAEVRSAELEERLRQREHEQTERHGDVEPPKPPRAPYRRGASSGRKRRGGSSES